MNTKTRSVGRPAAEIKYPRGIFTMKELFALNRCGQNDGVCKLTVIKHVDAKLEAKFLTLLKDRVMTGKVGKPAHRYIRTAVYKGLKQARKARGGTPSEAPIVEVAALPATPAPSPAVIETSAPASVAIAPVTTPEISLTENTPAPVAPAPVVETPAPAVTAIVSLPTTETATVSAS